ncbi:hypothetical protein ABW20_dc0103809 [Dactylellina cionopaga]|nr:hypothetical protein ABW20_dc0103809 [Dactylellina cionopaga]
MPTRSLAIASRTSKYIHDIATYIINRRLRNALEVDGYKLVFECYPADDKESHPCNHCEYLGVNTSAKSSPPPSQKLRSISSRLYNSGDQEDFNPLTNLYSHHKPTPFDASYPSGISSAPASTTVTIDSGDIFTQVCASANLVKPGSVIKVFESFFRVRRDWLDRACEGTEQEDVVWVGIGENVGLKISASGKKVVGPAIHGGVRGREEEPAVEYRVEYESLVIRATYLLEMVEKKKPGSFFQNLSAVAQPKVEVPAMDVTVLAY